jgi:Holliday junction resolvase-like predicted endonuclease
MSQPLTSCRNCGQALSFHQETESRLIELPCSRCGYIIVVEPTTVDLTVKPHDLTWISPTLRPTEDSRIIGGYLHTIAGALLQTVVERVQVDLPVARRSLLSVLSRREQLIQKRILQLEQFDPSPEPRVFPTAANLLYGVLAHTGALSSDLMQNISSEGVASFLGWLQPITNEIVTIARAATSLRRGEIEGSFDGSKFTYQKTPRHTAMVESILNQKRRVSDAPQIRSVDDVFSKEALEAESLVLGFNARDITDLAWNGFERLKARTVVQVKKGNVYFIRVPEKDDWLRNVILSCTLSLRRLRQFRSPFFFDLGVRVEPQMTGFDAILNSTSRNWSLYYPFSAMVESTGETQYVFTSRGIVAAFLANLEEQRNSLAEQLIIASKARGNSSLAVELAALVERSSRALEATACDVARSSGWMVTRTSASLPCGDIDNLLARRIKDELLIVVVEIKDVDMPGHRDDAYESQARIVAKALKQLDTKAKWVAMNWCKGFGAGLFPDLRDCQHGTILKLLVTRNHTPFEPIHGAECMPLPTLNKYLSQLQHGLPTWLDKVRGSSILRF